MGRKAKTWEEVNEIFAAKGFKLLSKQYICYQSPLDYICANGHQNRITFAKIHQGRGCFQCSGRQKHTIDEVRELFSSRGFKLLSDNYINANSPLSYICDKGHQTKIRFNNLQQGQGCSECKGLKKHTLEEARELFSSRELTLLSNNYKNSNSVLDYRCSVDHVGKMSYNSLQQGIGCKSCAKYGFSLSKPATLYYLRFQFEGNFYYKIGITNGTVTKRFQKDKTPYIVIKETVFKLGKDAYGKEQAILKKFSQWRYKGHPFLIDGNTELFTRDVLYADDSILGDITA